MTQFSPSSAVDFVIVGSGAAGGIMAKQLSVAGFKVVVLEQGGWGKYGHEHDYTKDEYLNDNPSLEDRLMSDPSRQRNTFRRNDKEKAVPGTHAYGCVVGGGTVTYGGSSWRHLPWEFNEATTVGAVAGSGLADWPVTYEELEPYYTQAEWEMGIAGRRVNSPLVAPMSKEYPVPPMPLKASGALFKIGAAKLGWTVVEGPIAILSRPYGGRSACVNCGMCSGFGCHVKARSSSAVTMLPLAEKTGNCEISYGLRGLQPGAARWGALYKRALLEEANHKMTVACFVTQLPLASNRVDLDPDVKDDWGLPAMRITSTSHPDDIKSLEFFRQRSIEILEAAGAKKVWPPPVNDSRGGAHNRGTCRMGNDPKTSVVDRYHRAHDVFIVDGSNMVTGGRNHPTMTIQALAFRAADHLIRAARTGDMKVSG